MLCVLIIVVLVLYVLYTQRSGPTDGTNEKIHPVETDTLSDVIDRIEWSLLRENRINYPLRYLACGLWVTFLGSYMITNTLPTPGTFLRTWIVMTIVLLSLHGFYHWHTDKFSSFAGLSALATARGQLGLK